MTSRAFCVSRWPDVPVDATYTSEILAAGRYSGTTPREMAAQFMGVADLQGNIFAMNAGRFVETLGGGTSAEQIIRKRTPFQFFASFLSHDDELRWGAAIAAGEGLVARTLAPPTRAGRLFAPAHRMCSECLADDTKAYGVGHWHVIHQFPAIIRCPRHEVALHDQCGNCGFPLGSRRSRNLPGDRCSICRSPGTAGSMPSSLSKGYRALESLMVRALNGQAAELRPFARMRLIDRVIHQRVGTAGLEHAMDLFLKFWSVRSTDDLEVQLGCKVSAQRVLSLFRGVDSGTSRSLQAAVVAFALAHADASEFSDCMQGSRSSYAPDMFASADFAEADPQLLLELCEHAVQIGYPIEGARALAAGQSSKWIAGRQLASPEVTRRFLLTVSQKTRQRYELRLSERSRRRIRIPPEFAAAREVMRMRIEVAVRNGCRSRVQLFAFEEAAYRWSIRNDQAWLDETLPRGSKKGKGRYGADARPSVRKKILDAIQSGVRNRSELGLIASSSYHWARKNDRRWLDEVLPSMTQRKAAAVEREAVECTPLLQP